MSQISNFTETESDFTSCTESTTSASSDSENSTMAESPVDADKEIFHKTFSVFGNSVVDIRLLDSEMSKRNSSLGDLNENYWFGFLYEPVHFEHYDFASEDNKNAENHLCLLNKANFLNDPQKHYNKILYHMFFTFQPERISKDQFKSLIGTSTGNELLNESSFDLYIREYYCFLRRVEDWKLFLSNTDLYSRFEKRYLKYISQPNVKSLIQIMELFDSLLMDVRLRVVAWCYNFFDNSGNLRPEILKSSKMAEQALEIMKQVEILSCKQNINIQSIKNPAWSVPCLTKQSILGFYSVPGVPIRTFQSFLCLGEKCYVRKPKGITISHTFTFEEMRHRNEYNLCSKCGNHSSFQSGCKTHPLMEFYNIEM